MSVHLNILCLICINFLYIWNHAKFAQKRILPIFNSHLCSKELNWTVPITVITCAARTKITPRHLPFVERWLPVLTGWSTSTPFMLYCCLPVLPCAGVNWTGKLVFSSKDLNLLILQCREHCNRLCIITKFPTLSANRLLDWANPRHIEPSDQLATKKTDNG